MAQRRGSVTLDGMWTTSSDPSTPSQLGFGKAPDVPLPTHYPRLPYDASASLLQFLTLTLIKHQLALGEKPPLSFCNDFPQKFYSQKGTDKRRENTNLKKKILSQLFFAPRPATSKLLPVPFILGNPLILGIPRIRFQLKLYSQSHQNSAPHPFHQVDFPARIKGQQA